MQSYLLHSVFSIKSNCSAPVKGRRGRGITKFETSYNLYTAKDFSGT